MGGAIGSIVGGGLSLLGANQARRAQQSALGPQKQLAQQKLGLFRQASPYYGVSILARSQERAQRSPQPRKMALGARLRGPVPGSDGRHTHDCAC
jgi:hypothetical protein